MGDYVDVVDVVMIIYLQICLDEAQMVECTTTKVGLTYLFLSYLQVC